MPFIECPHCGESTFAIAGWADVDHCANCGRPLVARAIEVDAVMTASERLERRPPAAAARGGGGARTKAGR